MPPLLDGLDPEQRLVAEALTGPVVVLAGAGTGKTRAITHRIAHAVQSGTHAAGNGLAVTFTNRAAGEMRQRLAELNVPTVTVRTFHAAALSQLRYFWPTAVGGQFPQLVSSKAGLVGQACREMGLPSGRMLVRDLATEIEWAGATMVSAGAYAQVAQRAGRTPVGTGADVIDLPGVARVISGYQDLKTQANVIDFEDVLLTMIALIGDRPDIADEIHKHYRWFTVDEYQDVTPAQDRLLSGWLGERDDVCVVGDASQTIYSFAGASPDALGQFARRWPNATEVRLDRCYRSTPQVVAVANAVIGAGGGGRGAGGQGARAGGRGVGGQQTALVTSAVWLRSQRPEGPRPEVVSCGDDAEEAGAVAARIADLVAAGAAHRDVAILMRTNSASEPIEVALAEAGIPYVMRGAERFFERPEVRESVARMRGQALAGGSRAGPVSGSAAGSAPREDGNGLVEQTRAVLAGMGWLPAGPPSGGATRERWESLAAVLALAEEVEAAGRSTMSELVEEFERRAQMSHAPTADGVTLATLHAAKGLEWPVVFIVGAAEGNLPIVYADTDERIAEERRLFYVGVTRARDRLVITWALTRPGSGKHRQASRFLSSVRNRGPVVAWGGPGAGTLAAGELDPNNDAASSAQPSGLIRSGRSGAARTVGRTGPDRCRVCGAGLVTGRERTLGRCRTCPGNPDPRLAEALGQWRAATAAAEGVLASAVLTDVALAAVEERRPTSRRDLLEIPGMRPEKLARYAESLLAIVSQGGPQIGGQDTRGNAVDDARPVVDVTAELKLPGGVTQPS